jgi:hypothetical protein
VSSNPIRLARKGTMRQSAVPAARPFLAIIAAATAAIALVVATGASARPALASVTGSPTVPANFSKLPAAWHGYAPPVTRAAAVGKAAAADATAEVCTGAQALYNGNSGLVMEVYNSSTAAGGIVDQWTYNGTETQHWCFFQTGTDGQSPIYEIVNNNSGLCLDLPNDNQADGQHIQQWPCNATLSQMWLFTNYDTYDTLESYPLTVNADYLLEVYNSSKGNGGEVDIWNSDFTAAQTWCPGAACIGAGSTTLLCVDNASENNRCILGGLNNNLGDAQLTNEEDIITERFAYPDTEFATGVIQSYSGGSCLQLNADGGDTVRLAPCVNDAAEQWTNIYNATYDRTEFVSYYDPSLCLSADYDDGILKADPCSNNGWYQAWGTS